MRCARRGTIAHIAGIGSYSGAPNAGIFCSSKAAISIALEALQQEVISFGVRVCLVQLGHFRTLIRRVFDTFDGTQQGDPEKGVRVIIEALTKEAKEVPFLLPVGPDVPEAEWKAHKGRAEQMQAVHKNCSFSCTFLFSTNVTTGTGNFSSILNYLKLCGSCYWYI
ncbi:uncharacterized protein ASPGLDRAFT_847063 [Aspergillus glaucus CBS 516.65]|uniref:Ketoreductase (KR) domain-containing protein n=1 Tax=Aspergillus glaucus CBS 516.65 TaxID=1160497 RepID=A0A1L9V9G6_ASPGL|nr:hypothetical protein ASPGLDRAFT_847063 [Aspergillus glaucus CBS 516.65]OJJ80515.1 hypothetical protein ASPGLDRAFT_847063 [Aspergillus glaucus CBS 516.65]